MFGFHFESETQTTLLRSVGMGRGRGQTNLSVPFAAFSSSFPAGMGGASSTMALTGSYLGGSSHPQHPVQPQKRCTAPLVFWSTGNSFSFDFLGQKEETNTGKAARFQLR